MQSTTPDDLTFYNELCRVRRASDLAAHAIVAGKPEEAAGHLIAAQPDVDALLRRVELWRQILYPPQGIQGRLAIE